MDKRIFLFDRQYKRSDGTIITAKVYKKSNNRGMTCRMVYGEIEVYIATYIDLNTLDKFVIKCLNKNQEVLVTRPYKKDNVYYYVLGKKRYYTNDKSLENNDLYFYVPKNVKDPLTIYKKNFLNYLNVRVKELASKMGLDISGWKIYTGLFLTYYGVCFPTKHILKFDYRLFAYKSSISDCIIYHELTHILEIHHNERFYKIVKMYCPNYDILEKQIKDGYFEGRLDEYVI